MAWSGRGFQVRAWPARRGGRGLSHARAGRGGARGSGGKRRRGRSCAGPGPGSRPGAGPGMAVPFVEDWDLVQTLGEGAYGE